MIAKLSHSSCEKLQKMAESLESGPMKDPIVAFVRGHQVKHKATNFSPRSSIHSFPNPSGCTVPQYHCGCTGSHRGLFWRQMCHRCPPHRQMLSLSAATRQDPVWSRSRQQFPTHITVKICASCLSSGAECVVVMSPPPK